MGDKGVPAGVVASRPFSFCFRFRFDIVLALGCLAVCDLALAARKEAAATSS